MGNSFGKLFQITTFGESHGVAIGCVIDGCPPGIKVTKEIIQEFLNRRKPGQNDFTTARKENDNCEIISGIENNITLGTPITILVKNSDIKRNDYNDIQGIFRPSHADFTTYTKYGITSQSGGGRASARETVGRVAGAAIAKTFVNKFFPKIEILSFVKRIANIEAQFDVKQINFEQIENSEIRCPDNTAEKKMKKLILATKAEGDSVGGSIFCTMNNIPTGLGEPVFNKLEADLARAMLSLPASKSFEIGDGILSTYKKGSENNDAFYLDDEGEVRTKTNHSGGIQGGISNGMPIFFTVGFKPVSTIFKTQNTVTKDLKETEFKPEFGRHDPCVLPRAVPLVEAMAWLVLADHILCQNVSRLFR